MPLRMTILALVTLAAVGCDEFPVGKSYEQHHGIERGRAEAAPRNADRGDFEGRGFGRDNRWERDEDERPRERRERRDGGGWGRDREMPSDRADRGRDRSMPSDDMPSDRGGWGRDRKMPSDSMPSDRSETRRMPSDDMPSRRDSFRKPLPSER